MAKKDKKKLDIDPFIIGDPAENITDISIEDVLSESFGRYSKHIILERSIPDIRDGLKPVQRRILYGMKEEGITYNKPYRKSAKIVGHVMGSYHPHGDSSIYEALVRMAQDWKCQNYLIDFSGNRGDISGSIYASSRYTECRLHKRSQFLTTDLEKETVPFVPNYSDDLLEPTVLPASYPNILTMGVSGIAAGYATQIPPFNLNEVVNGTIYRIKNENCSFEEIVQIIKGPDFPTGGIILGADYVNKVMKTGKGKLPVRSKVDIETEGKSKLIVVTETPYDIPTNDIVKKLDEIRIEKKIPGIVDIRDESCLTGLRIVVEVKKDAPLQNILNYLYKNTDIQANYNANMVAIADNAPKQVGIMDCLDYFIKFRKEVITKRTIFDLNTKKDRLHILEGLMKALDILDEVIKAIRKSKNKADAKESLIKNFDFSEKQAEAIVVMRLYKLSNTDITEIEDEFAKLTKEVEELQSILDSPEKLKEVMIKELEEVNEQFPTPRKTKIEGMTEEIVIDNEALIPNERCVVAVTRDGYIKRVSNRSFLAAGETFPEHKEDDHLVCQGEANTRQNLIFFTNTGKYGYIPVYKIPECKWKELGSHISTSIKMDMNDKIINAYLMSGFPKDSAFISVSENGQIKQTKVSDYEVSRSSKTMVNMTLIGDDKVVAVMPTVYKEDKVYLTSKNGLGLSYSIEQIPTTSPKSKGVKGMNTAKDTDKVVSMVITPIEQDILLGRYDGSFKHINTTYYADNNRPAKGKMLYKKGETVDFTKLLDENTEITYEADVIENVLLEKLPLTKSTQGFKQPNGLASKPIEMLDYITEVKEGMQPTPVIVDNAESVETVVEEPNETISEVDN